MATGRDGFPCHSALCVCAGVSLSPSAPLCSAGASQNAWETLPEMADGSWTAPCPVTTKVSLAPGITFVDSTAACQPQPTALSIFWKTMEDLGLYQKVSITMARLAGGSRVLGVVHDIGHIQLPPHSELLVEKQRLPLARPPVTSFVSS